MIDEKKLIEEIEYMIGMLPTYYINKKDEENAYLDAINRVLSVVKRQQKVGEWIPVEEGLPEHNRANPYYEINLVTIEDGDVCLGVYRNDDKEWWTRMSEGESEFSNRHKVVAWKPRPEPYRKEDNK